MLGELWKDIPGFERFYKISTKGRIISYHHSKYGKLRRPYSDREGYLSINLSKNGQISVYKIHRLVAIVFIPIPQELLNQGYTYDTLVINHKDECKYNNDIDNLEWCTVKYNSNYGTTIERRSSKVSQFDLEGNWIKNWIAIEAAKYYNLATTAGILNCCSGASIVAAGYLWRYTKPEYKEGYKLPNVKTYYHNVGHCIPIAQFDLDGNFIQKWDHAYAASRALNIPSTNIAHSCTGIGYSAAHYIWRYWKPEFIKGYNLFTIDYNLMLIQPVAQMDYKTKEILEVYENALIAYKLIFKVHRGVNGWQRIYLCCKGLTPAAFQYRWKFV